MLVLTHMVLWYRDTDGYSLLVSHTSRESLTKRVLETEQKASALLSLLPLILHLG